MSDPRTPDAPPADPEAKAEHMLNVNDQVRETPTRPGLIAWVGIAGFLVAFVFYIIYAV